MSTHFIPNALLSVFTEAVTSGEDAWGQAVPTADPDDADAVLTNVPAFISEYRQSVGQPGGGRETVVRRFRVRVRPRAYVYQSSDRVRDAVTGDMYEVDEVINSPARGIAGTVDVSLICRRVN